MKKIFFITILFSVFFSSCQDFLDEKLVSGISYDYYNTEKGLEDLLSACYTPLRYPFSNEVELTLSLFGTDTYRDVGAGNKRSFHRYDATVDANEAYFHNIWTSYYQGINNCNIAINRIPNFKDGKGFLKSDEDKKIRESEARFLRAYYYFYLVQTFGKIPLLLDENISVLTDFVRAPVADVYDSMIEDLTYAQANLPNVQSQYGRATKGAAMHLLSKVYLTRGSAIEDQRGQSEKDMENAALYAEQVINLGEYELLDNFADVFDPNNQKNKEIIFSVQFSTNKLANVPINYMHRLFLSAYQHFPGILRSMENGTSATRLKATDYLLDVFDRKNDSRFYKTFQMIYYCNNPTAAPKWTTKNAPSPELVGKPKFGEGDTALVFSMENNVSDNIIDKKPYHFYPRNKFTVHQLYFPPVMLHLDPNRETSESTSGTRDWFLMRLAETYLIAAEAYGRMGEYEKAVEYINKVTERASYKTGEQKPPQYYQVEGGNLSDLYKSTKEELEVTVDDVNSPEKLRDVILDERARELHSECQRWYDLVRTETLVERVQKYNPDARNNIKEFHKLRPIPQAHIDRLTNPGPVEEEQNVGYY